MEQSLEHIEQKLEQHFKHGRNVLLEGRHGTGKTTIASNVLNRLTKNWLYFSASTLDPFCDFVGIPKETQKNGKSVLTFVLPEKLSDDSVEAIFLDEYNRSHKKVRNATLELIQFKSINGRKFPNLKVVWAAINPADEDSDELYDVEILDPAQLDRFQVYIKVPNNPSFEYFKKKYDADIAKSAIEWWNHLPKEAQKLVSPRRLDYAIELFKDGGDLNDVLSEKTNPSKLLLTLQIGSVEEKINELFDKKDGKKARAFLNLENNYQGALPAIKKNADYMHFFLPLLNSERVIAQFFNDKTVAEYILLNAPLFREPLEEISSAKSVDDQTLRKVNYALKKLGTMTIFN